MLIWGVIMFVNIDGIKINYIDKGQGEPILLLHGWGSCIPTWTPILKGFEGYRVIAPDLPGCGESEILKTDWGIDDYCDFVLKFMDAVGIANPILAGHSHGGRISIKLTAEGKVNPPKLILFDSAGIPAKKTFKKKFKIGCFKTAKWFLTLPIIKNFTKEALDSLREYFGSADYKSAPEVMRKTLVRVIGVDLRDIMPNIKCPTLLIWGENDPDTPLSDAKQMEKLIPDSGLCVIKGADHFSFLRNPGQVIAILKSFLS